MVKKKKTKKEQDNDRLESELKDIILNNIKGKIDSMPDSDKAFSNYLKKVQSKQMNPYDAADKISKLMIGDI